MNKKTADSRADAALSHCIFVNRHSVKPDPKQALPFSRCFVIIMTRCNSKRTRTKSLATSGKSGIPAEKRGIPAVVRIGKFRKHDTLALFFGQNSCAQPVDLFALLPWTPDLSAGGRVENQVVPFRKTRERGVPVDKKTLVEHTAEHHIYTISALDQTTVPAEASTAQIPRCSGLLSR